MTQACFAKLLKISPQYLCDVEKNRRAINMKTAGKFAKILKESKEHFIIQCLQDYLARNNIYITLYINKD